MAGYSKLFSEIVTSSIWSEDDKTRIVWITMLALKDSRGYVPASVPGLANAARVSIAECETAIAKLEANDQYSRTKDNDGRRIKAVDGGWLVLNHDKYRDKRSDEARKEYQRRWQQEHRRRQNVDNVDKFVDTVDTMLTHSDADTDSDNEGERKQPATPQGIKELSDRIIQCHPSMRTLNRMAVENTVKNVPIEAARRAVDDFTAHVANCTTPPQFPLAMLSKYLDTAARGGKTKTSDKKLYPSEVLRLLEELRSQAERLWNKHEVLGKLPDAIKPQYAELNAKIKELEKQARDA